MITIKLKIKEVCDTGMVAAVVIDRKEKATRATKREIRVADNILNKIESKNTVEFIEEDPTSALLKELRKKFNK